MSKRVNPDFEFLPDEMKDEVIRSIISVLKRLHYEAKTFERDTDSDKKEYYRRGVGIQLIFHKIKEDLGEDYMFFIFNETNKVLGETLNPIHTDILKVFLERGYKIKKVHKF
jgi:hypothetical protein